MEIARLYRDAQRSFVDLTATFTDRDWATEVPCCPEWTVRDVLSHVAGVTIDIAEGNVEGAATDPWTAVQVERWRATPAAELIARWSELVDDVAGTLEVIGEVRPPIDCHSHEHDVRHALERPGNRDSELVRTAAERFGGAPVGRAVTIELDDGTTVALPGPGDPIRLSGLSAFELVRSRLGRRSRSQVLGWDWSVPPPDELLDEWFVFGPSAVPIEE